jgi:carbon storage regulator
MLVLSRKLNEQIMIGDNICITVVAIRGNQVRLGFEAPRDVSIQRQELVFDASPLPSSSDDSSLRLGRAIEAADLRPCFAQATDAE